MAGHDVPVRAVPVLGERVLGRHAATHCQTAQTPVGAKAPSRRRGSSGRVGPAGSGLETGLPAAAVPVEHEGMDRVVAVRREAVVLADRPNVARRVSGDCGKGVADGPQPACTASRDSALGIRFHALPFQWTVSVRRAVPFRVRPTAQTSLEDEARSRRGAGNATACCGTICQVWPFQCVEDLVRAVARPPRCRWARLPPRRRTQATCTPFGTGSADARPHRAVPVLGVAGVTERPDVRRGRRHNGIELDERCAGRRDLHAASTSSRPSAPRAAPS